MKDASVVPNDTLTAVERNIEELVNRRGVCKTPRPDDTTLKGNNSNPCILTVGADLSPFGVIHKPFFDLTHLCVNLFDIAKEVADCVHHVRPGVQRHPTTAELFFQTPISHSPVADSFRGVAPTRRLGKEHPRCTNYVPLVERPAHRPLSKFPATLLCRSGKPSVFLRRLDHFLTRLDCDAERFLCHNINAGFKAGNR